MPSLPLDSTHGRMTRAWHAIITFGKHSRSNYVGRGNAIIAFGKHKRSNDVRAWHANITFGQHTLSNDVGCGMPASPLGSTHGRKTSRVDNITSFGQHIRSKNVERGMPSLPWDITHGQTTSGVACYHRLWAAQTVGRHRVWHAITAVG